MTTDRALNQRRYRLHHAGDHSLCSPLRCPMARAANPFEETPVAPDKPVPASIADRYGLEQPGRALWDTMTAAGPLGPTVAILLVEACRITDRLDRLNRQLRGEDWLRFRCKVDDDEHDHEVVVYCDRVLAEAREQATALKGLMAQIHMVTTKSAGAVEQPARAVDGVTNLRDRIIARRNHA